MNNDGTTGLMIPDTTGSPTGPVGASIGEQGSANPQNLITTNFPPSATDVGAAQLAALAQKMHKECPPTLFQTWSGVLVAQGVLTAGSPYVILTLDFVPAYWVVRAICATARGQLTVTQGGPFGSAGNTTTTAAALTVNTANRDIDYQGVLSATQNERFMLPGTSNQLFLLGDPGISGTANIIFNVAAIGGDHDPTKVY